MKKDEYLKRAFNLYNEGKISAETYDTMLMNINNFIDEDDYKKEYRSINLLMATAEALKEFLHSQNIYFESSSYSENLTHFEILCNDEEENVINDFLDNVNNNNNNNN